MLQNFRNNKGQIFAGEYLIVLAIAAAGILTMSVYFRRAVQARIRDGRASMIGVVRDRTGGMYTGLEILPEYEPYYLDRAATTTRNTAKTSTLEASFGLSSGIAKTAYNDTVSSDFTSSTASPSFGD
jgi:hypothetical protein